MQHFVDAYKLAGVDGALAASVFHKQIIAIEELKQFLTEHGVTTRS